MTHSAHQAAIDQAYLLANYLNDTPSDALDPHFVTRHTTALNAFVQAAALNESKEIWCMTLPIATDSADGATEMGRHCQG